MLKQFDAPIPGQSLTTPPGEMPYERPPQITDPEEAIQMYLTRLTEPDKLNNAMDMLEAGLDIETLTKGLIRSAVANGIHSIDVGLIVAPIIHEFIKVSAEKKGIEYEEGLTDEEQEEQERKSMAIAKGIHKLGKRKPEAEPSPPPEIEEEIISPADEGPDSDAGFMRRRGT